MTDELSIRRDAAKGKIYSHVRRKWLVETPEETVRQQYLLVLVNEYDFILEQIAEELELTGRGSASARADFVIWRSAADKAAANAPFIIVECKSDSVTIKPQDYSQGENYARICGAPFFVTHNSRETRYWRVKKDKLPGYTEEIENIPHGGASDKDIEELLAKLRTFKEKEFADLLHQCHNVIRNREKKDPAAAFDEIAKVLFIKVYVERQLLSRRSRENLFTVDVLNRQIAENPLDNLFQQTKLAYAADKIFEEDERINLKPATGEEIVRKLEKYNLSDTSEDVKGVAFERFLGRTFRGEIGQFFTPRTIVEFMVHMIDPQEGEIVCDPASGSGGFLIRVFEIVRENILAAADAEYSAFKAETEADSSLTPELRAKLLLGIVPEVPDDAITSPEYQVWRLKGGFLPEFMALMLRTEYFLALVAFNRVGGVKQRMYYSNLAEIRLPAVPDDLQRIFSERRRKVLCDITAANTTLAQRRKEIEQMILGTVQL